MTLRFLVIIALVMLGGILFADETGDTANQNSLSISSDLTDWKQEAEGAFVVTNGVLQVSGGKGWLRTEKEFGDFVIEAEWRGLETNFNSGFLIRAEAEGKPWPTNVWQINLKQTAVGELLRGNTKVVPSTMPPATVGEWMKFRIEARDRTLTLYVNGKRAWEFQELEPASGHLGIQAEGKMVEIRNLRIRASGSL